MKPQIETDPTPHITRGELLDKLSIMEIADLMSTLNEWGVSYPKGVEKGSIYPWDYLAWEKERGRE